LRFNAYKAKLEPAVKSIKAFYLSGTLGVALPAGNWHWPPIPLGKKVKLLFRKCSNSGPCDTVALKGMAHLTRDLKKFLSNSEIIS
jgi:ureidoglycolate hydrolase